MLRNLSIRTQFINQLTKYLYIEGFIYTRNQIEFIVDFIDGVERSIFPDAYSADAIFII